VGPDRPAAPAEDSFMHRLRPRTFLPAGATLQGPGRAAVLAVLAAVTAASFLTAQPAGPAAPADAAALDQKILAEVKDGSEIMKNLTHLSDQIGPRLTGSPALKRANEYTADVMRRYGLENVKLEPWSIPATWERGFARARVVEPNNGRTLLIASMGWSPGTKGKVVGDVVVLNAKSGKDLAKYKGKLKDAIVLRGAPSTVRPITDSSGGPGSPRGPDRAAGGPRRGRPDEPKKDGPADKAEPKKDDPGRGGFDTRRDGAFESMRNFRNEITEFLRTEGAACVVSDAGKPHSLLTTTGGWRGMDRPTAADPIPAVFMAHEHYALLHRLATRPEPAKTRVEIEIENKLTPGPVAVYNTVGEIRGSEKPDEFVVVGAHLDSWDLAQGTTDNGTGTSIVLEVARALARSGVRPKRTIRFALFTGEEQGLHGSREYVKLHEAEMPKTSMALVHDTGTGKVVGLGLNNREVIRTILEAELASLKSVGFTDLNLRSMGGSDHQSFESKGVPGFAAQQDMTEYRLMHHSQSDTLDKAREADLIQGAQVLAVTAMRVANLPTLLPRDKKPREKKE
jgi:carboxypeptidase Q